MIVLASQSASRRAMLEAAGVPHECRRAGVDEAQLKRELIGIPGPDVAMILAEAKGLAVATAMPGRVVLAGDSLVEVAGRQFDKPESREAAAEHLAFFSVKTMALSSAVVLARDGRVIWRHVETAQLKVRPLSARFIAEYLDAEWPAVSGCVGVFRIEARGVQLFETIEGSHFTVLGMPLLAVLGRLRDLDLMPA